MSTQDWAGSGWPRRVAVLGCGTMAGAMVRGLLDAGLPAEAVVATARGADHRDRIAADLGVEVTSDNAEAVRGAELVILGVKPHSTREVAAEVAGELGAGDRDDVVVVSIAAGVQTAEISKSLGDVPLVRVMPNTPVRVGRGAFIISPAVGAEEAAGRISGLLGRVGTVVEVPENLHDAATAVSGSGAAYIFLVAEAMIDAGVAMGLPRDRAGELVTATLAGSAELLAAGEHPAVLRAQVTSPGGTTAAALDQLEAHGLRTAFARAMEACRDRAAGKD